MTFKIYLGLKETPTMMVDVLVPKNTELLAGRINAQPSFGLMNKSGFQYQLLSDIPINSFQNIRPIVQPVYETTDIFSP